jgi:hypothetical protein
LSSATPVATPRYECYDAPTHKQLLLAILLPWYFVNRTALDLFSAAQPLVVFLYISDILVLQMEGLDDTKMSIGETHVTSNEASPDYVTQRHARNRNEPQIPLEPATVTCGQLDEFRLELRKLITYFTNNQTSELREINNTMKDIKHTNECIEASITELTKQNEEFKKKITQIEKQLKDDNDYIIFLENKLEEVQIGARKTNIEIKNVPKRKNETKQELLAMVICLFENLECKVTTSDIKDVYRVGTNKPHQQTSTIIAETNSALLKLELIKAAKNFNSKNPSKLRAEHLGLSSNKEIQIYISEHLTSKGSRLHFLARDLKKSKNYKYCWTSYGKVYVRKSDDSPIIQINSEEQVQRLMQE